MYIEIFSDPLLHRHWFWASHQIYLQWDYSSNVAAVGKKSKDMVEELVEPWSARRSTILNKYTTSEKLSIVTSFLSGGEKGFSFLYWEFRDSANSLSQNRFY